MRLPQLAAAGSMDYAYTIYKICTCSAGLS